MMGNRSTISRRWDAPLDRTTFILAGLALFAIKHGLDLAISSHMFGRPWSLTNYLIPSQTLGLLSLPPQDRVFYGTMLLLALPFIAVGIALTVLRLRDAGISAGWAILFFLPLVNLILFFVLAVLPSRRTVRPTEQFQAASEEELSLAEPERFLREVATLPGIISDPRPGPLAVGPPARASRLRDALLAIFIPLPIAVCLTVLSAAGLRNYGWGVFVGLPFGLAFASAVIYGWSRPATLQGCVGVAMLAALAWGATLLLMAFEGAICLLMAAPLAVPVVLLGAALGHSVQKAWHWPDAVMLLPGLAILLPGLMLAERAVRPEAPVFAVATGIEIDADPQHVWNNVVGFPELAAPTEWLFRAGIAFPVRAIIDGHGAGAVRHCEFSTGAFVEPIEIWDAPRLLKFAVTRQAAPLRERSIYRNVHPPHLDGFFVSRAGQFRLTPLPSGRTRLEGTTWYQHHMWPAAYWRLWSDLIIHRIHARVLEHIRNLSESPAMGGAGARAAGGRAQ